MRHAWCLAIAVMGCGGERWDGALLDSVRGTFAGDFDTEDLKHAISGVAALEVDLYRCGGAQCADVAFDGVLSNASAELHGPSSYTIRGVTIDHPELWSAFEVDGHKVRVHGRFLDDDQQVWLDIFVDVPPFGYINVGEITLDLILLDDDASDGPGLRD